MAPKTRVASRGLHTHVLGYTPWVVPTNTNARLLLSCPPPFFGMPPLWRPRFLVPTLGAPTSILGYQPLGGYQIKNVGT